jgi:hypothetical protein
MALPYGYPEMHPGCQTRNHTKMLS